MQLFKYKLTTIDIPNHRLLVRENPVSIEIKPPYIIKMFPSPNATNVPTGIQEIYVEFNVDMSSNTCIFVPDGSTGISYTNAYWKSGKILAIRIDGKLQSQTRYNISLGIPGMCQLIDNFGALLPVTQWSFNTKKEYNKDVHTSIFTSSQATILFVNSLQVQLMLCFPGRYIVGK